MGDHILHASDIYRGNLIIGADETNLVDDLWAGYESHLPRAIEQLVSRERTLPAEVWLHTLVPFVASLFVRGKAYGIHYQDSTNANSARIFELQRLLAPVTCARWLVVHSLDSDHPYITNDLALAPGFDTTADLRNGWVIPLTRNAVLILMPQMNREVLVGDGEGSFHALIEHHDELPSDRKAINRGVARAAVECIVGPREADLVEHAAELESDAPSPHDSAWTQIPGKPRCPRVRLASTREPSRTRL